MATARNKHIFFSADLSKKSQKKEAYTSPGIFLWTAFFQKQSEKRVECIFYDR